MTPTYNNNSATKLIVESADVGATFNSNKQNYIDNSTQTIDNNRLPAVICNYKIYCIPTVDTLLNSNLKQSIVTDNAIIFKKILSNCKDMHEKSILLGKYTSLIVDHKANACLIELLKFLTKNNINNALDRNYKLYSYIHSDPELRILVLYKYYYALGCAGIYNMLIYAIDADFIEEAIRAFNILLKKFPVHYISNQNIGRYHNPIVYAIEQNKFDIFQKLVSIAPKYFVSLVEYNITPLMVAAISKNSAFLEYLLQCKYANNTINYQGKDKQTALSLAIEHQNSNNIKMLINHAPLIVFEKASNADKTVLEQLFKDSPNYFAIALANKTIANQVMNPIFFADFFYEKNNPAYKLLLPLKKQIPFKRINLGDSKKLLYENNNNYRVDALIDYKPEKKQFCLDHINVDTCYIKNLNLKMLRSVSLILPKLKNLAVYIRAKQYYHFQKTSKIFSYGDENASIALIVWLIKLGATQIKIILSPPDNSTSESRQYISRIRQQQYNKQKIFCLKKLSHLLAVIKHDSIKPQKINYSGCELNIGFVDDDKFMNNYFCNNNTVAIKKYSSITKKLKHQGTVISFSASAIYKDLVADDLVIIKPFAFAKKCEQIHTDLYIDKQNQSIYTNINSLKNTPCSIIPEIKTNIELKYNSTSYILEWLIAKLVNIKNANTIANTINLMRSYVKEKMLDYTTIYGLHHEDIKSNAYNIIKNWIKILDNIRYERDTAIILAVFPNNLLLDIDRLIYDRDDMIFLSFCDPNIERNLKLAVTEKKIILFTFPSLPKEIFHFLIKNSNLPMLTEGANTSSFLLQKGIPYLSLLPGGLTKIPYNIGNSLQSFLIEALSYKLVLNSNCKEKLAEIYNLVKQKKFIVAKDLIDNWKLEHDSQAIVLSYLWEENTDNPIQERKMTAYQLIIKGDRLSSNAYNILLQALANDFDSIANYIKQVITLDNTQEKEHIEIIKYTLKNNFNNAVITSLYSFFKEKKLL